ncbi:MAG: hypothetical protein EOO11_06470 [Chitinophagaceae bacterium]|nr:MAG: hypothetical protein EOO11_06470 [Chitinophagaceae bacterium]
MRPLAFLLLLAAPLLSCNNGASPGKRPDPYPQARALDWLAGAWRIDPPDSTKARGELIEEWRRASDSSFSGRSYMVSGPDTSVFENILLVENGPHLLYIASVTGQNNNEPVSFQRSDTGTTTFTFINERHDFPQQIRYRRLGTDSLRAEIEGPGPDGRRREVFVLRRVH